MPHDAVRRPAQDRAAECFALVGSHDDEVGSFLDGKYSVFGRISDGMETLVKISETPVDAAGLATDRVEIRRVTIRDTPPEPFVNETAAELGAYHAVLDTSEGPITIDGRSVRVSVSVGVASVPVRGGDPDSVLRDADRAMYADKLKAS